MKFILQCESDALRITNEVQRGIHFPAISKRGPQTQPSPRFLKEVKQKRRFLQSLYARLFQFTSRVQPARRSRQSRVSVTRKEDARARGTCLRASSRGQLRSPEMDSLLAGYANSFSLYTGYLCIARPRIACLLALSSHLENIISDSIFEILYSSSSQGGGGKAPPRLASQASLASFWGFFLLTLFNILSWKIDFFSHGDNSLRFLLQNFPSQALQLAPLVNDYLLQATATTFGD